MAGYESDLLIRGDGVPIEIGEPAPWFVAATNDNPSYAFSSVAGRYVALCFFGSAGADPARLALELPDARPELFDGVKIAFFGVSVDPQDRSLERVRDRIPGVRFFWDFDRSVSRQFGMLAPDGGYPGFWLVLDPMLRVIARMPLPETERLAAFLSSLPPLDAHAGMALQAPVLLLPRVFEPAFCGRLIELYEAAGGEESGFMRQLDGQTVVAFDREFKRRRDWLIEDERICAEARARISSRLVPEVHKAFQFQATRIERYVVACYDAAEAGQFRAHRDNTTPGTAHRRFAVTINLNTDEYDGGELWFPEFGPRAYRPATGGAVVFSCSLLHEARPVTRGKRYAFLPFLYDEAAAEIRLANNPHLGPGVGAYDKGSSAG